MLRYYRVDKLGLQNYKIANINNLPIASVLIIGTTSTSSLRVATTFWLIIKGTLTVGIAVPVIHPVFHLTFLNSSVKRASLHF